MNNIFKPKILPKLPKINKKLGNNPRMLNSKTKIKLPKRPPVLM